MATQFGWRFSINNYQIHKQREQQISGENPGSKTAMKYSLKCPEFNKKKL